MIAIVDYGMGNVGSIRNMLRKFCRQDVLVTSSPADVKTADKVILPGVGAFDVAMRNLTDSLLGDAVREQAVVRKVPVLGICLGMQVLTNGSEEGVLPGLGFIPGRVIAFPRMVEGERITVPHMGWNEVEVTGRSGLFNGLESDCRFYFVHSYYVRCDDEVDVAGTSTHGVKFCSAVRHENVLGVQFHPEKSHRFGLRLLKNFVEGGL